MVKANFMATGEKSSSNLSAKSVHMESQCWFLALNQSCIMGEKKTNKQTMATKKHELKESMFTRNKSRQSKHEKHF